MIEEIIKSYLNRNLLVPAFLETEDIMPKRYVLFEKTGSSKKNCINGTTFTFQSYAESLYEAAKLNEEVKTVVENLIVLNEISKAKLVTDYNYTDNSTKKYRYQAVFDIKY